MYDFLKDKTALYIEDDLDVLKNISTLLNNYFQSFYIASDGESGYELFLKKKIDVLLVDIELPKMSGIDLVKEIRKANKTIPIIIISAYTKTDYLLESIELNLDKYIVKPLTSKKIHLLLNTLNEDFSVNDKVTLVQGVMLHKKDAIVSFGDTKNSLTQKELHCLSILARRKIINYNEINALWEDGTPTQNAIRSCVKQLRKKLPENILKTRNGVGYFIEDVL